MPWATTTTTLWEGYGLEVQRQVRSNAAVSQATPGLLRMITEDIVEIRLVQQRGGLFHTLGDIARVFSAKQIAKVEKNPERWARSIIRQRLQSARNRELRCRNTAVEAAQSENRWIALAEPLGVRPNME